MAHTVRKHYYSEKSKKYVVCEVLVLDDEERVPGTDRREIVLQCSDGGDFVNIGADSMDLDFEELYFPETELIDQYEDFENRSD